MAVSLSFLLHRGVADAKGKASGVLDGEGGHHHPWQPSWLAEFWLEGLCRWTIEAGTKFDA